MKRKLVVVLMLLLVGGGAIVVRQVLKRSSRQANGIVVSGNIEITDAELSFRIAGRLEQRLVDEGQTVQQGVTVALLDHSDLTAEVAMRQAELAAAQALLDELEAGTRPQEIAAAKARLASARASREQTEADWRRAEQLLKTKVLSDEEYSQRKSLYEVAAAREREAQEQLKLLEEGPRKEQVAQGRAKVAQATAALDLAKTRLGYATLAAPLTGVVLVKHAEPGEYLAAGTPVVSVGDVAHPWLRAFINETDLGRVKLGQRVRVTTDSYPGRKYEGEVTFIASEAEFTPKNVQTEKERVKLVYRIKVDLANPQGELKPGMPADGEILIEEGNSSHARHQN